MEDVSILSISIFCFVNAILYAKHLRRAFRKECWLKIIKMTFTEDAGCCKVFVSVVGVN